jgi:hypothetical protein
MKDEEKRREKNVHRIRELEINRLLQAIPCTRYL